MKTILKSEKIREDNSEGKSRVKYENMIQYCLCKCGQSVQNGKQYKRGHNTRIDNPMWKEDIPQKVVNHRKLNPEYLKKLQEGIYKRNNNLQWRQKLSESRKKYLNRLSPEQKSQLGKNARQYWTANKETKGETLLYNFLETNQITFQKQYRRLIGNPDAFVEPNIAIFVDGCYWHGCFLCFPNPTERQTKQINRDKTVTQHLIEMGYIVKRIPEHNQHNIESYFQNELYSTRRD